MIVSFGVKVLGRSVSEENWAQWDFFSLIAAETGLTEASRVTSKAKSRLTEVIFARAIVRLESSSRFRLRGSRVACLWPQSSPQSVLVDFQLISTLNCPEQWFLGGS